VFPSYFLSSPFYVNYTFFHALFNNPFFPVLPETQSVSYCELPEFLHLKDFTNLTDEEITEACEFDFRYQYALHTTSFEDQLVSERSLSRFRSGEQGTELLRLNRDLTDQLQMRKKDLYGRKSERSSGLVLIYNEN